MWVASMVWSPVSHSARKEGASDDLPQNKVKRLSRKEEIAPGQRAAELNLQPKSQMNPPVCLGLTGWGWRGGTISMSE